MAGQVVVVAKSGNPRKLVSPWIVTASADNAIATATKAAVAGQHHYLTSLHFGWDVAKIGAGQVNDNVTAVGYYAVHNERSITFNPPHEITLGNKIDAILGASGTAGKIGYVTMTGYTSTP